MVRPRKIRESNESKLNQKNVFYPPFPFINEHVKRGYEMIQNEIRKNEREGKRSALRLQEKIDLVRGVNFLGMGCWAKISKCSELCFGITGRDGSTLRARFMTLKKKLEHDGTYFFLSNLKAQCTRPIDLRPKPTYLSAEGRGTVYEIPPKRTINQTNNT